MVRFHVYVNAAWVRLSLPLDGELRHEERTMEEWGWVETLRTWRNEGGLLRLISKRTTWTNEGEYETVREEETATEFQTADGLNVPCFRAVESPECGFIAWN